MKTKLLLTLVLLAGSASFARAGVFIGARFGPAYYGGCYRCGWYGRPGVVVGYGYGWRRPWYPRRYWWGGYWRPAYVGAYWAPPPPAPVAYVPPAPAAPAPACPTVKCPPAPAAKTCVRTTHHYHHHHTVAHAKRKPRPCVSNPPASSSS